MANLNATITQMTQQLVQSGRVVLHLGKDLFHHSTAIPIELFNIFLLIEGLAVGID